MEVFEAIRSRRSIKYFDPDHQMTDEEIERLLSAAILSPTAFNIQNWRFVVVKDPELRRRIRAVSWDQRQVTDASLLVILCADVRAWDKDTHRYWRNAPKETQDSMVPAIKQFYGADPDLQRDEAMRSGGIAAQTLMLAAKAMGYDSCPMDGFDFDAVGRLIHLPEDHVIVMFVAIGKSIQPARPRPGQLPLDEVVITDRF